MVDHRAYGDDLSPGGGADGAANELTGTGLPDGTATSQDYYADGSLHHYISARGKTTTYVYNGAGQLTARTDGAGRTTNYIPDAAGNVIWTGTSGSDCRSDFSHCAQSTYDADGELQARSYYDGTPSLSNIAYNSLGERTAMTDSTGTAVWTYDNLGRMTSTKDGLNNTVAYGYDIVGNQTSITYPGSLTVTRDFDAANRIDWIQDYKSNKTTFAYNPDSALTTTTEPTAAGVTDTIAYDNADHELTSTTAKGASTLAKFVYTRDGANQILTDTTTGITDPAHTYAYDKLERLKTSGTTAAPINHTYDADSDLVSRTNSATQAYDDAGQICWQSTSAVTTPTCGSPPSGATTYTYNAQGDRTAATPGTGTAQTYGYDFDNNLTSYGTTTTYKYDATGLRLSKKIGSTTTKLIWDRSGSLPLLVGDAANKYVYGPDGNPLEQITTSGTVTYLHHDQLGSTRLLTSTAGANTGTYSYDAFGSTTTHTGTTTTPLLYAGQYLDSESGLYYMRARSYDPVTGQFISRDPVEDTTRAPYVYGDDSPTDTTDPSGLISLGDVATGALSVVHTASGVVSTAATGLAIASAATGIGNLGPSELLATISVGAAGVNAVTGIGQAATHHESWAQAAFETGAFGIGVAGRGLNSLASSLERNSAGFDLKGATSGPIMSKYYSARSSLSQFGANAALFGSSLSDLGTFVAGVPSALSAFEGTADGYEGMWADC